MASRKPKYDYIALLDADDLWEPEYLATQVKLIQDYPECEVFAVSYNYKDEFNNFKDSIINCIPFKTQTGILNNYFKVASNSDSPINSTVVCATKKAFSEIDGFPTGVTSGEDLLTWAKLACKNNIAYSKKYVPHTIHQQPDQPVLCQKILNLPTIL